MEKFHAKLYRTIARRVGWMFGECLWWQKKKCSNADENIELFHYKIGSIDSLIE